jgi:hypothetical protein
VNNNLNIKQTVRKGANSFLHPFGLELVKRHSWDNPRTYIPFDDTINRAKEAGLSVGDYIDATYQEPGATQTTIDQMTAFGVYDPRIERVCEIGPGSGRYLEKTLQVCRPDYYEFYETSNDWAQWLVQNYHVIHQATDGISLAATPDASIDLVQAHRVFSYVPFFTAVSYYFEMMRVVRDGGKIVFDILTEECMDLANLEKWLAAGFYNSPYPSFMSKRFTLDIFEERGFTLVGNFNIINKPGVTEYFIFTR